MKITIEPGPLTTVDGVEVRAWNGETDAGVKCVVFAVGVAVLDEADQAEFQELMEREAPQEVQEAVRILEDHSRQNGRGE